MSRYKTLRTWAALLMGLGLMSMIVAGFGVFSFAMAVEGGWETLGVLAFGIPFAVLLVSWPFALGQALRALADIGDQAFT
jgi:hypothetical protein